MGPTVPDLDTEKQDEQSGPSGPRIRCPLCGGTPSKRDVWSCTCGHAWNTFDTGGVCPACVRQWTETQCPSCHRWGGEAALLQAADGLGYNRDSSVIDVAVGTFARGGIERQASAL